MALFGRSKTNGKTKRKVAQSGAKKQAQSRSAQTTLSDISVLLGPRLSEKGVLMNDQNRYAFDVSTGANKTQIADAVENGYDVVVESVQTVKVPSKNRRRRGRPGKTTASKKAYVTLKKGDTIEF